MTTRKRITIVSELFYPEDTSTAYVISMIANHLKRLHKIRIICGPEFYGEKKKKDIGTYKKNFTKDLEILRTRNLSLDKNKLVQRTFRQLFLSILLVYKILKNVPKHESLLVMTNPQFLILFLSFIPRIKNRYNYDILVHDVFPENLVSAGIIKEKSFLFKFLLKIYNRAYQKANRLIVVGRDMELIIQKKVGHKNTVVIPNWSQVDSLKPESRDQNCLINKLRLKDKLVLQFAGNLGRVQGLEFILEVAKKMKNTPIHFVFVGDGALKDKMLEIKKQKKLDNVTFLNRYKRSEQQQILNASDIGIVSLSKNMVGLGVPSKSYNIMAVGNPILYIGETNSEIAMMIEEHGLGWVVESGNIIQMANVLNQLLKNKKEIELRGKKSRLVAEKNYSERVVLKQYEDFYQ